MAAVTYKRFPPLAKVREPITGDGAFSAQSVTVADKDSSVTLTVGVAKEGFTPTRMSVKREGGVTTVATVMVTRDGKRSMLPVRVGKKLEIGTVIMDPVVSISPFIVRDRKTGEPPDKAAEGLRLDELIELNRPEIEESIVAGADEIIKSIPDVIVPNLDAAGVKVSADKPQEVLVQVAAQLEVKGIGPKDSTEDIARKIAQSYMEGFFNAVKKQIDEGKTLEDGIKVISEQVGEPSSVSPLEYKVGDVVKIRTGLDKDDEFRGTRVGGVANLGDKAVKIDSVIDAGKYGGTLMEDGTAYTITTEMIEGPTTYTPPTKPKVRTPPAPSPVPSPVPTSGAMPEPTPPLSSLTIEQQTTWKNVIDTLVRDASISYGHVIDVEYLENTTSRNAYYFFVIYEKAGDIYGGPMWGAYGAVPNTKSIGTKYPSLSAAMHESGSKTSDKRTGDYVEVASYSRGTVTPSVSPPSPAPLGALTRLVIYGGTYDVKDDIKAKFDHYKARYGGKSASGKIAMPGRTRPVHSWQLIGPDAPELVAIGQWAETQSKPGKMPIKFTTDAVSQYTEWRRAPDVPAQTEHDADTIRCPCPGCHSHHGTVEEYRDGVYFYHCIDCGRRWQRMKSPTTVELSDKRTVMALVIGSIVAAAGLYGMREVLK